MKIIKALTIFDRFKRPILLFSRNSQKHSTKLGVLVSLSIYGFLAYFFLCSDIITRKNPKIIDQAVESTLRPEIQLRELIFAVENDEAVSFVDKTIFSVQGFVRYLKLNEKTQNGFDYVYDKVEELHVCTNEDFNKGTYYQKGFKDKYCFSNKNISIKGFWD